MQKNPARRQNEVSLTDEHTHTREVHTHSPSLPQLHSFQPRLHNKQQYPNTPRGE